MIAEIKAVLFGLLVMAASVLVLTAAPHARQNATIVHVPPAGSAERKAITDGLPWMSIIK